MEEQRKNEFPRPQETPDWAQETLAPAKPPFSASRKEVLLAFGMYVLAYVYLGSGWWALPLFAAGFIAAAEYQFRDVKRPHESWVWLLCVVMIVGCLTWRELHPDGRPKECIAGTGLSKNTVYKWWDNPPTVRYEDGGLTVKIRPSQALNDLIQEDLRNGP